MSHETMMSLYFTNGQESNTDSILSCADLLGIWHTSDENQILLDILMVFSKIYLDFSMVPVRIFTFLIWDESYTDIQT